MSLVPELSLAIDNRFASKRWTRPADWMPLIKDRGITLIEASADTECDPLCMGEAYIADWIADTRSCSERFGVRVVNLCTQGTAPMQLRDCPTRMNGSGRVSRIDG